MKPGFFCLPRHDPTLLADVIRRVQPSLVKFWISSTSAGQVRAWRESSPSTVFLAVDGGIGDNPEKNSLDFDLKAKAREHVSAWCRWRDQGFGSLYMTYNEPPVWSGKEYRKRLVEYTAEALRQAHAAGINLCIFNFSVAWPKAVLDDENWWPEFEPAIKEMRAGDYLGLHEYWPRQGPLDLAVYPWMAGKHRLCPYNVPILISECGLDQATVEGGANRGWRLYLSAEQYVEQLKQYHATLDPRVKGTAIFLLDYENNVWESFDLRYCASLLTAEGWDRPNPMAAPAKVLLPLDNPRVTQWFGENPGYYKQFGVAGHNGIDFGCAVGTPIKTVAAGKVFKIRKDTGGYGWSVWINHGWGVTLYAHLSAINVQAQQDVSAGQTIALSGNTGNSTGPHLHFGMRIYGTHNVAMNDWIDPKAMLGLGATTPSSAPAPEIAVPEDAIRNAIWNKIGTDGVIAYNPDAAFAKKAREWKLGAPLTNEHDIGEYRAQGFAGGIVFARIGDWSNVKRLDY
jgi:murein DD-endopeptidase MepM/ murein hydrolase activator NlpD